MIKIFNTAIAIIVVIGSISCRRQIIEAPLVATTMYGVITPIGSMNAARAAHTATLLPNGKVLITGGGLAGNPGAELYDPATGKFAPAGNMTAARTAHTMTMLQDGRVLIAGGHSGRRSTIVIHASAEIYDPTTGTFQSYCQAAKC
jgi:hypothetical protein